MRARLSVGQHALEQRQEPLAQPVLVRAVPLEEVGRELAPLVAGQEHHHLGRHGARVGRLGGPGVQAEGQVLPLEHLRGVEEAARRGHRAGDHLEGVVEEVQVVGPDVGQGQDQGVAGGPPRPADALEVVGRRRRHRADHRAGQVAHVDAHLQGRRAGQQVGGVGLPARLEQHLDLLPGVPLQQAGVFVAEDPLHLAGAVEVAVVALVGRLVGPVGAPAEVGQRRLALPVGGLVLGQGQVVAVLVAADLGGVPGDEQGLLRDRVGVLVALADPLQQPGLGQRRQGVAVQVVAGRPVEVRAQALLRPVEIPVAAVARGDDRVEDVLVGQVRQEAGQPAVRLEGRHERVHVLGQEVRAGPAWRRSPAAVRATRRPGPWCGSAGPRRSAAAGRA